MSAVDLKTAIKKLDSLPALPVIAQKLLALNFDSDEGERAMLKLIEQDPQIAAKIIGLGNTPLFGASKRVTSISDATMLLGLTRVKAVTMGIAVMTSMIKKPTGVLDVQSLWLHSLAISMALRIISRAMPRNTRPLDDEIFLAGLLHDIGYMVLNQLDPKRSDELQKRFIAEPARSCTEIEAEMIELNHCELGAELGSYWDLPESIIAVMRYHHTPDEELAAIGQPLVSMVSIAEKVLSGFGIPEQSAGAVTEEDWKSLGIDPAQADELIEQIKQQAEEAKKSPTSFS